MAVPYVNDGKLGVNLSGIFTPSTTLYPYTGGSLPSLPVGTKVIAVDGSEWLRVLYGTGGSTGPGYVVVINSAFTAVMMSNSVGAFGDKIGVAPVAASAGDYGWVQVYGTAAVGIQVNGAVTVNTALASTSTAGALDDATTTGTKNLPGIVLTTAAAGAGNAPAELNWPTVGTTN
jgi:hypothetical protein